MSSRRTISWTTALRDLKADRAVRPEVREERLRSTAGLRSAPVMALSAWRGRSGRRYVVGVHDIDTDALDATPAVAVAVSRDPSGIASILAVGITPGFTVPAGATEVHLHRLAETAEDRAAIAADLGGPVDTTMTVNNAFAAMLALYAVPNTWTREGIAKDVAGHQVAADSPEAVAWSLEGALYRVVGDPEEAGITEGEWRRRMALETAIFDACGVELMAFNDAARRQDVVVAVLRVGRDIAAR